MDYILLYFIYCQWELWIHSSFSLRKHWGVTGVPGTDTEGWGRWRKCTPWVHPLNRDKDNIRQALRGVSNSVEAICPCGDARGIRSSAQKWAAPCRYTLGQNTVQWKKSRGAGVMRLNSALRSRYRASFYPSRSTNKSKITDAWPGIWIFLGQDRMPIREVSCLLRLACQCAGKRCHVSTGMAWSDTLLRELLRLAGMSAGRAAFHSCSRQSHSVGSTMPFCVCSGRNGCSLQSGPRDRFTFFSLDL